MASWAAHFSFIVPASHLAPRSVAPPRGAQYCPLPTQLAQEVEAFSGVEEQRGNRAWTGLLLVCRLAAMHSLAGAEGWHRRMLPGR
mmetsp:Transcript_17453/g.32963  ORF Transcript_17453/g.32963 Transcript_17453/m.32963 type:complete len:86 (-) Transcript_17453:74-331(-)